MLPKNSDRETLLSAGPLEPSWLLSGRPEGRGWGHSENQRRIGGMAGGSSEVGKDSRLMFSSEQLECVPEPQGLKAETYSVGQL